MEFIDLKKQLSTIRDSLESRFQAILNHGKYIMGPEVKDLEKKLAKYVNTKNVISCSSGTDALLIPLLAHGIGPGDAVITSPFTYIATGEVISLLGATPIFVDIYSKTYNIDPSKISKGVQEAESKGLKPKAIIPVDLFGLPARYRLLKEEAKKFNLFLLEDAAQGFGGSIGDKKAGSFCKVAATSFFPAKPLGCYGDGGAIFTDDDELADIMRSIRVHGGGENKYDNVRIGINGRLDTIQAAVLLEKMEIFPNEIEMRNQIAEYYSSQLPSSLTAPFIPKNYKSSWAQYSLLAQSSAHRNNIMKKLKSKNIPTMIYYPTPLHLQKVFDFLGYKKGDFPISEKIAERIFSIPMHPYLENSDQDKILKALKDVA